jgi:four helix bundle suffix protein
MEQEEQHKKPGRILKPAIHYKDLYFYQKADVIYQLTYIFCQRFLPQYGDRTVDQMVQSARSGKQNIVEGIEAGSASIETEIRLLNVARSSLQELREDYEDYLHTRRLTIWEKAHPRFAALLAFCKTHNQATDYTPFAQKWTAEEYCNTLLTLCHITDKLMCSFLSHKERQFEEQGGIKERMHAVRTGYRKGQEEKMKRLEDENGRLKAENEALRAEIERLKAEGER